MISQPPRADGYRWIPRPSTTPSIVRYLGAVALVGVALLIRMAIAPPTAGLPFITFFPTTALAAILFGLGPGLVAAGISGALAGFLYLPPIGQDTFTLWSQIVFLADALLVCGAIDVMHRYQEHYDQALATASAANRSLAHEVEVRRQAMESALLSEEKWRTFFNRSTVGLAIASPFKGWVDVNPALCDMLGYSADELQAKTWIELTHPDDIARNLALFEQMQRGESEGYSLDKRFIRKDGRIVDTFLAAAGIRDQTGAHKYSIVIIEDITERKRGERALAQAGQQLAATNAELRQFAHTASHDLQEPLRMVTSYLGLLERRYGEVFDDQGREFLHYATDGAKRMAVLIHDLLEYARVDSRAADPVPVETAPVVEEALTNLSTAIAEAGGEVAVTGPLPVVRGDRGQLVRLFQNLIGNAVKYRDPIRPPQVRIGVEKKGVEWEFSVVDNGIGIAPEHFERIFLIFQRLHTRGEYDGSGVGLAIVKRIVERHGGRVWVESQPGQGAAFSFTLPCIEAAGGG